MEIVCFFIWNLAHEKFIMHQLPIAMCTLTIIDFAKIHDEHWISRAVVVVVVYLSWNSWSVVTAIRDNNFVRHINLHAFVIVIILILFLLAVYCWSIELSTNWFEPLLNSHRCQYICVSVNLSSVLFIHSSCSPFIYSIHEAICTSDCNVCAVVWCF